MVSKIENLKSGHKPAATNTSVVLVSSEDDHQETSEDEGMNVWTCVVSLNIS